MHACACAHTQSHEGAGGSLLLCVTISRFSPCILTISCVCMDVVGFAAVFNPSCSLIDFLCNHSSASKNEK